MRSLRLITAAAICLFSLAAFISVIPFGHAFAYQADLTETESIVTFETADLGAYGAYRFQTIQRFSQDPDDAEPLGLEQTLIILKDGHEIDHREGWRWEIYSAEGFGEPRPPSPKPGSDITGDGIPDVVLMEYSGGAHCCSTYYVFELRETLRVSEIDTRDYPLFFKQFDGGPSLELVFRDSNFAYWRASFGNSAAPVIILRYHDGAYEPAPDLMRTPRPSEADLAAWAEQARTADDWIMETKPRGSDRAFDVGYEFLTRVADLVYEGHADLVRPFVDLAWPSVKPGKDAFIEELMECRVRRSNYWPTIAAMNGLPADPPIGRCPADDEG